MFTVSTGGDPSLQREALELLQELWRKLGRGRTKVVRGEAYAGKQRGIPGMAVPKDAKTRSLFQGVVRTGKNDVGNRQFGEGPLAGVHQLTRGI